MIIGFLDDLSSNKWSCRDQYNKIIDLIENTDFTKKMMMSIGSVMKIFTISYLHIILLLV